MRIEGTFPQPGIQGAEQKKRSDRDLEVQSRKGDRVELSEQARALRAREEVAQSASNAASRPEVVEEARKKARGGVYDRPEVRKEIAHRLLKSPAFREILEERARRTTSSPISKTGEDRVQIAKERVKEGFYDRAEVRSVVAERLLKLWLP